MFCFNCSINITLPYSVFNVICVACCMLCKLSVNILDCVIFAMCKVHFGEKLFVSVFLVHILISERFIVTAS